MRIRDWSSDVCSSDLGLRHDTILLARNLGPAELLEYDRRRLKGVVLEEGSLTAHVTIVARAMGVPVLGRVRDLRMAVSDGDEMLHDTTQGPLVVRPTSATEHETDSVTKSTPGGKREVGGK